MATKEIDAEIERLSSDLLVGSNQSCDDALRLAVAHLIDLHHAYYRDTSSGLALGRPLFGTVTNHVLERIDTKLNKVDAVATDTNRPLPDAVVRWGCTEHRNYVRGTILPPQPWQLRNEPH